MHLVRKAVRNRATRAAVATSGIAISTLLVLVLSGAYRALTHGVESYVGGDRIHLWVAPRGTDNLIRSSALFPSRIVDSINALPAVLETGALLRGFVAVRAAARAAVDTPPAVNLLAIGYEAPNGLGGPRHVVGGHAPIGPSQIVLDRATAYRLSVTLRDTVTVNNLDFELVGISTGTNLMATQFAFLDLAALERSGGYRGQFSFVAAELRDPAEASRVARSIAQRFPRLAAYTRDQFIANNVREVAAGFRPMQLLVSGMGVLAAAVLVALLVQGGVEDRREDIAVLVAMGARIPSIAIGVIVHATALVLLGGLVGGLLSWALHATLLLYFPTVELAPRLRDLVLAVPLFAAASWLAALAPLMRLRAIDPITAFRP